MLSPQNTFPAAYYSRIHFIHFTVFRTRQLRTLHKIEKVTINLMATESTKKAAAGPLTKFAQWMAPKKKYVYDFQEGNEGDKSFLGMFGDHEMYMRIIKMIKTVLAS